MINKMKSPEIIYFHKDMEPTQHIEVWTIKVDNKLERGVSIALYSPEPQIDWCFTLTEAEALVMARRIIEAYEKGKSDERG